MRQLYLMLLAGAAAICITGSALARSYDAERANENAPVYPGRAPEAIAGTRGLGMTAPQTLALQRELDKRGYSVGPIDGIFGSRTEKALREFQENNDLAITGKPNTETLDELGFDTASNEERPVINWNSPRLNIPAAP